jgi:hypothetical protein
MTPVERCPRCSARRIEGVDTCPRCQWRFAPDTSAPAPSSQWVAPNDKPLVTPPRQPVPVQLQPMDRRAIAGWSLAAFQVRCLGTVGGCAGMASGAVVGFVVAGALTNNAFLALPGLVIGAVIGVAVGIFVSLRMMAR